MTPSFQSIVPGLGYWQATENPLSSDVGLIEGSRHCWLFDVGAAPETAEAIRALPHPCSAILSHFHQDHVANLPLLQCETVYASPYTRRHLNRGVAVSTPLYLSGEPEMYLFPFPSSHAKGCLALQVDQAYCFLGDGLYTGIRDGRPAYNAGQLQEQLRLLRSLPARYLLLSHDACFLHDKEEILEELEQLLALRRPGDNFILPFSQENI